MDLIDLISSALGITPANRTRAQVAAKDEASAFVSTLRAVHAPTLMDQKRVDVNVGGVRYRYTTPHAFAVQLVRRSDYALHIEDALRLTWPVHNEVRRVRTELKAKAA